MLNALEIWSNKNALGFQDVCLQKANSLVSHAWKTTIRAVIHFLAFCVFLFVFLHGVWIIFAELQICHLIKRIQMDISILSHVSKQCLFDLSEVKTKPQPLPFSLWFHVGMGGYRPLDSNK